MTPAFLRARRTLLFPSAQSYSRTPNATRFLMTGPRMQDLPPLPDAPTNAPNALVVGDSVSVCNPDISQPETEKCTYIPANKMTVHFRQPSAMARVRVPLAAALRRRGSDVGARTLRRSLPNLAEVTDAARRPTCA
ncbi:unnamed protein product [Peniophora sp. CBMAI 1063]|nr:unnamed protein product [Peniophora sp. CBMAI 1063]